MTGGTIDIARREGRHATLTPEQLDDLAFRLDGSLLSEGEEGWKDAVLIWNDMAATVPALVAQPISAADVAAAVAFAREHGLLVSVKGGGHNIAGTAIAEDGLTLDMSRMREITVDPEAKIALVGPGCRLQDVDRATQEYGLATVLGFVSEVGVAGLTLGGGFGHLARRFGWAVDNLQEVEIVTADGEVRIANREQHDDLFWAVRGGGGNFGVVTSFTFRLHEVGPIITGGLVAWGGERAREVLETYRDLTESAPRELTVAAAVLIAPPAPFVPEEWRGKPVIAMVVCHSGPNAEADLAPIRALGKPVVDLIGPKPYAVLQSMLDEMEPKGLNQYWKTEYLPGLSSEFLEAFREAGLRLTSPLSQSVVFHIGGALNERADDDGAVGNRDAKYVTGFAAAWPSDDPRGDTHVAWARDSWESIRPFSTGGNYVNFQLAEDSADRTADAYGSNFERLRRVKAAYDPDNLFRVNRNIPPAA
jgi:FAD/FMN-containing dehydrogenase